MMKFTILQATEDTQIYGTHVNILMRAHSLKSELRVLPTLHWIFFVRLINFIEFISVCKKL